MSDIKNRIIEEIKKIYDPEIPVNIYELGLIYKMEVDNENKVTFYSTKTIKDTIDGMWVSGLPEKVNLIVSGQEYISIGETIN